MVNNAFNALGAALLALAIAMRIEDGSFTALVQTWYEPLLIVSVLLLVACSAAGAITAIRSRERIRPRYAPAALLTAVIFAIPVVVALGYQPSPLNSASLDDTSTSSLDSFSATANEQDPLHRNVYQWAYAFASDSSADLVGLDFSVVGFVHHSAGEAGAEFQLARFVVACCVADARGYSVPIRWDSASGLETNAWVRVTGRVGTDAEGQPIVLASSVESVDAPSNPYIYP